MWVQRIELKSSRRATSALNCWAIYSSLYKILKQLEDMNWYYLCVLNWSMWSSILVSFFLQSTPIHCLSSGTEPQHIYNTFHLGFLPLKIIWFEASVVSVFNPSFGLGKRVLLGNLEKAQRTVWACKATVASFPGHREEGTRWKHMAFLLLFVNLDCEFLVIKLFTYFSWHKIIITIIVNSTHQDGYIIET